MRQTTKKAKPEHCPRCGKKGERAGTVQFKDELQKAFRCNRCGIVWHDVYDIVFRGYDERILEVPAK